MEQEERDAYVSPVTDTSKEPRGIMNKFITKISTEIVGPQAEEWLKFLEMLMQLEKLSDTFLLNFKKFLPKSATLPVWRIVHLAPEADPRMTYETAIEMAGMTVSSWARDILRSPTFSVVSERVELKLVRISVADLGFPNGATHEQIYTRVEELGLGLCPAEVGPQLRLQYPDQPTDEDLLVGMEPIAGSDGILRIFRVSHSAHVRRLEGFSNRADDAWRGGGDLWVFVSCK